MRLFARSVVVGAGAVLGAGLGGALYLAGALAVEWALTRPRPIPVSADWGKADLNPPATEPGAP